MNEAIRSWWRGNIYQFLNIARFLFILFYMSNAIFPHDVCACILLLPAVHRLLKKLETSSRALFSFLFSFFWGVQLSKLTGPCVNFISFSQWGSIAADSWNSSLRGRPQKLCRDFFSLWSGARATEVDRILPQGRTRRRQLLQGRRRVTI